MQTSATNRKLRVLLTGIRDKTLIPNPHFQRRLVWSNMHKNAFLQTVLDGLPFPEIFISAGDVNPNTGDGTELIVDGQQRITTLYQYFVDSKDLILGNDLPKYSELEQTDKLAFLEYAVVIRDLGPLTEEQTREIFHRINSTNYSLNAMEVNNSRFDGALKRCAEDIVANAADGFFQAPGHPIFSSLDGRRMNDTRFALTLIITMMSGYFNRDDEHELYLQKYNDSFPEEAAIRERIEHVCQLIDFAHFSSKSRIWQKADLLTAMVELDRFLHRDGDRIDPDLLRDRAQSFYEAVEAVTRSVSPDPLAAQYYRRVRSGINDRVSRYERGQAFRTRVLQAGDENPQLFELQD
ncbi:DUF262 domain-containing protein [Mycobacterium sp. IS-1590]|uniref:GmrSD restriction endonuclease domain-containing protein n=1 Tax=Mycobacterium sp. IS-1590 TaxID=1772286 RepID=UPI0009EBDCA0|nr:DUF262 domain-containing protein [Mycobacterium sp. IS-1590]